MENTKIYLFFGYISGTDVQSGWNQQRPPIEQHLSLILLQRRLKNSHLKPWSGSFIIFSITPTLVDFGVG